MPKHNTGKKRKLNLETASGGAAASTSGGGGIESSPRKRVKGAQRSRIKWTDDEVAFLKRGYEQFWDDENCWVSAAAPPMRLVSSLVRALMHARRNSSKKNSPILSTTGQQET